jgi:alginate O-acetyltransferase complex protein AlgI
MLFNSVDYLLFLPCVFLLYWFVTHRNLRVQNVLLLLASYVFYGWWDWRFLSLIAISTLVDYVVGLRIDQASSNVQRKRWLYLSISVNIGFLAIFKYFNFFIESWIDLWSNVGYTISPITIQLILPVGISFYTFQTLSYSIDIYYGKLKPTHDILAFAAFVSFFPQLVAGPIERAKNLLPQFTRPRSFNYQLAMDGVRQILWGLFKKIVIADSCAEWANLIFNNSDNYSGSVLIIGAIFFAFQIYGDFSGYSDIAIGTSRLFGFSLMRNFAFPYFSRDVAEFWRRWHISLSTWFRDYLYIPLGGSRGSSSKKIRNIFIIFIVSGLWHGANWTFIVWGALNAVYILPLILKNKNRDNLVIVAQGKIIPSIIDVLKMGMTFCLTTIAWIFFRASDLSHAFMILSKIFSESLFTLPLNVFGIDGVIDAIFVIILLIVEWIQREKQHALQINSSSKSGSIMWIAYLVIVGVIILNSYGEANEFIYFQF